MVEVKRYFFAAAGVADFPPVAHPDHLLAAENAEAADSVAARTARRRREIGRILLPSGRIILNPTIAPPGADVSRLAGHGNEMAGAFSREKVTGNRPLTRI